MIALAALYGFALLWLAYEMHAAPVVPDAPFELPFDAGQGGGKPDARRVTRADVLPFHRFGDTDA